MNNYIVELDEAINSIDQTLKKLDDVLFFLNKAHGWGIFDTICGGFISTVIKRDNISKAKIALQEAKNSLSVTNKELQDVSVNLSLDAEFSSGICIGDYLFDGLIFDILSQNEINNALRKTKSLINELNRIKIYLQNKKNEN